MEPEGADVPRGRVVMLVDNAVDGDSRVQKVARSAAEAGWRVVLLGRSPDGRSHTWQIGSAEVGLLVFDSLLAKRRHEFRRRWLVAPFAYPPSGIGGQRAQWVKALRADLQVRRAQLTLAARSGQPRLRIIARRQALRLRSAMTMLMARWVSLRRWQLSFGQRARRRLVLPTDRLYTAFWRSVKGDKAWRRLEPGLWDYELAYGPVIDALAPDLIHAHDFRMLGVGARAAIRARHEGRPVKLIWDAHEFLPGVSPWQDNARWLPANCLHEREYAPFADAVITVSPDLADLLQKQHALRERPTVVLNAPAVEPGGDNGGDPAPSLRELCGLGPHVPLLVYSGVAHQKRGLAVMIEGLTKLDHAHVALVVNQPDGPYVQRLQARAADLGVADRVHVLPYVAHWQVVPFLASADVGVIPIQHWPNHEIALITKFFEYSHARLPVVVSDVRTMAETVRSTGQGEVFRAEDVHDYVRAVRAVLDDPQRYRSSYDQPGLLDGWTWPAQAKVLDRVYRRLLPERARATTGGQQLTGRALVDVERPAAGSRA